jgi:hypothetical protein
VHEKVGHTGKVGSTQAWWYCSMCNVTGQPSHNPLSSSPPLSVGCPSPRPHVNSSRLGGWDSRYATPHSPSCSPPSTFSRSMLIARPHIYDGCPKCNHHHNPNTSPNINPHANSDASPNVTANQTQLWTKHKHQPECKYLNHVHIHEVSHDTSTSDACQPDAWTTSTMPHYQRRDVEDSVSGRGMQLGHPGWYRDHWLLNSKGLLKERGGLPTLLPPSYFYIVGIPSHRHILLVDNEYKLCCHLPECKRTCKKKKIKLKSGGARPLGQPLATFGCVEHM